jgi:acetylornithine/succinyldiaminopimelate/putrescine aminotransferase/predicted amino acid dehydrogenase
LDTTDQSRTAAPWGFTALNPERRFLLHHVGFDKTIVRAEGNWMYDADGARYLDALAQYGALPFGHNPAFLWQCLDQVRLASEPSFVQPLLNTGAEALAQQLVTLCPHLSRVTFVNSGAEATEAAIKLARARTGKRRIITVDRGFHGKTNAALCATANLRYREPFLVDQDQFATIAFGDLAALERELVTGDVSAFIVESVQGEGGMRVQPPGYLLAAQALCKQYEVLLVLDEVQTGLGRTGEMFGFAHHGEIHPDIVLLAKALGGGLVSLGAVLCSDDVWTEAFGMLHSSTFANSHLATSIGSATIAALLANEGQLLRNASHRGAQLRIGLEQIAKKYPAAIVAIHGQGLMQGVELAGWSGETSYFNSHASYQGYSVPIVAGYLLNRHKVLTAPTFNHSNVLRIQPALTISEAEIAIILHAVEATAKVIVDEEFGELFSSMVPLANTAMPPPRARRVQKMQSVSLTPAVPKKKRRFAFLIHPTDDDACMQILPPAIKDLGEPVRAAWISWLQSWSAKMLDPAPVLHVAKVDSPTGVSVEGWLIATALTPTQMIRMGAEARARLMERYIAEAAKLDVDIVGLGAFTSVISQGGITVQDRGVNITTGNSLTAIASAEALLRYAALRESDIEQERFAVVGAAGSVGRLVAFHLAHNGARRLRLIGNADNRRALSALKAVAGEILLHALQRGTADDAHGLAVALRTMAKNAAKAEVLELKQAQPTNEAEYSQVYERFTTLFTAAGFDECPVSITTDVAQGISDARFVVTATSAGRSFLACDTFMQGAVICDVARPLDVLNKMAGVRDDVLVFEGGLMRLPGNIRFGDQNVLGYPEGVNLACLSESIVLAMEGATRNYSVGNRISYSEALVIYAAALKHGFSLYFDPDLQAQHVNANSDTGTWSRLRQLTLADADAALGEPVEISKLVGVGR